jgi:hypothetical protein
VNIDFYVKLRDAAQIIADACNEEVEKTNPARTEVHYNPENIPWIRTEGQKGPYERYPAFQQNPDIANPDYNGLHADLKAHDGKLTRSGIFYWLFTDDQTIGRKPSQK